MRSLSLDWSKAFLHKMLSTCSQKTHANSPLCKEATDVIAGWVFMNDGAVTGEQTAAPCLSPAMACTPHGAALPAGVCVCPADWGLWFGLFVYKREDGSLCPPAAVKTGLENQSEVSTHELISLEKPCPNKQTFLNERPSGLKHSPLG